MFISRVKFLALLVSDYSFWVFFFFVSNYIIGGKMLRGATEGHSVDLLKFYCLQ